MTKKYKLKKCRECGSYEIRVVTNDKNVGWSCTSCNWEGRNPIEEEVSEKQYLKYAESIK